MPKIGMAHPRNPSKVVGDHQAMPKVAGPYPTWCCLCSKQTRLYLVFSLPQIGGVLQGSLSFFLLKVLEGFERQFVRDQLLSAGGSFLTGW